jgi:response regulator RpfG family c-di-GMP phosphodiesterase
MSSPTESNFQDYKRAEKKALEIVAAMKSVSPKKVDIELALLVAVFELHKGSLPPETVSSIIQGHLKQIVPFYAGKNQPPAAP